MELARVESSVHFGLPAVRARQTSGPVITRREAPEPENAAIRAELTKLAIRLFLPAKRSAAAHVVAFTSVDESADGIGIAARTGELLGPLVSPQLVCVVDANPGSPSVHRHFGVANEHGWSEFLARGVSARQLAQPIGETNVWVIPYGSSIPPILAHEYAARLQHQVNTLRSEFAYVLIQAPPALSPEALRFGKIGDGLVLILEASSTQRETALSVTSHLKHMGARILGAVLNENTAPVPEAISRKLR